MKKEGQIKVKERELVNVCYNFPWKLREAMRAASFTQDEIANKINLSRVTINKYCSEYSFGYAHLKIKTVKKLASCFGISYKYFLDSTISVDQLYLAVGTALDEGKVDDRNAEVFDATDLPSQQNNQRGSQNLSREKVEDPLYQETFFTDFKERTKKTEEIPHGIGDSKDCARCNADNDKIDTSHPTFEYFTNMSHEQSNAADFWSAAKYVLKKEFYPELQTSFGVEFTRNKTTVRFDLLDQRNRVLCRFITLSHRSMREINSGTSHIPPSEKMIRGAVGQLLYGEGLFKKKCKKFIFMYDLQGDMENLAPLDHTECMDDWNKFLDIKVVIVTSHQQLITHFKDIYPT